MHRHQYPIAPRTTAKAIARAACGAAISAALAGPAWAAAPKPLAPTQASTQQAKTVVELETSSSADSVRVAQDLANLFNDGATRRLVTVLGDTATQNYWDLAFMHGLDLAILPSDINDIVQQPQPATGAAAADFGYSYVAKLGSEDLHIIAGASIKALADLHDQKVGVDLPGSAASATVARLLKQLGVPYTPVNASPEQELDSLRKGEIAAMVFFAEKPSLLALTITHSEGLHFVPVPATPATVQSYAPTSLTASDYPDLIQPDQAVDTISVGMVLAAANLAPDTARYHALQSFVELFFTQFPSLLGPGHDPMWRQVNLAAGLPGWHRFPPAQQWLDRNATAKTAKAGPSGDMVTLFSRFLDARAAVVGDVPLTAEQKQNLFDQFRQWQSSSPASGTN